jgi:hypothetical protein
MGSMLLSGPVTSIYAFLFGATLVIESSRLFCSMTDVLHTVTKVVLGLNVALPGAFLCILRELELVASLRTYSSDKNAIRNRRTFEYLFCYAMPISYMLLRKPNSVHSVSWLTISSDFVTQDHRFDLAKDYGCSASVHPSTTALLLTWIPPLLLCIVIYLIPGSSFEVFTVPLSYVFWSSRHIVL